MFFVFNQAQSWVPSIKNPYLGSVNWTVPENVAITVTLFRDSRQEEYEDKEWTFVIEDVSILNMLNRTEGVIWCSDIDSSNSAF